MPENIKGFKLAHRANSPRGFVNPPSELLARRPLDAALSPAVAPRSVSSYICLRSGLTYPQCALTNSPVKSTPFSRFRRSCRSSCTGGTSPRPCTRNTYICLSHNQISGDPPGNWGSQESVPSPSHQRPSQSIPPLCICSVIKFYGNFGGYALSQLKGERTL